MMNNQFACAAISALLCLSGATRAATDPIYIVERSDGKPFFSNQQQADSRLMLAGHSAEVLAFRHRFRMLVSNNDDIPRSTRKSKLPEPEILAMIDAAANRAGLNADLVKAIVQVESGFRPAAKSTAGAIGLMQVIPATGKRFGVSDLRDPVLNLYAGTTYLAYLLRYFKGDVRLALAGYNAGEGAVIKYGYRIPPYAETQAYVPAVLSAWRSFNAGTAASNDKQALSKTP